MKQHLCIGCGVCAAVCPRGRLNMQMDEDTGIYTVVPAEECPYNCGLCDAVCPFADTGCNEDVLADGLYSRQPGIMHELECGYYFQCWAGFCSGEQIRLNGASGGATTAFLESLLTCGKIERIVCAQRVPGGRTLFECAIVDDIDALYEASKSAYYPVEFSGVLREVLSVPGKYAIVCLPCVAKAIRLAQRHIPKLRERIVIIIGLVCGHGVNSHFGSYAAMLAGASLEEVKEITFRVKSAGHQANNSAVRVQWSDEESLVHWMNDLNEAWVDNWFTPKACLFCDDIYAECADIVFMDAWLPEFIDDYKGTNLLLSRTSQTAHWIQNMAANNDLILWDIDVQRVIASQRGVIQFKRVKLAHRLWQARGRNWNVSAKRVAPHKAADWNPDVKRSELGTVYWKQRSSLSDFQRAMRSIKDEYPWWVAFRRKAKNVLKRAGIQW